MVDTPLTLRLLWPCCAPPIAFYTNSHRSTKLIVGKQSASCPVARRAARHDVVCVVSAEVVYAIEARRASAELASTVVARLPDADANHFIDCQRHRKIAMARVASQLRANGRSLLLCRQLALLLHRRTHHAKASHQRRNRGAVEIPARTIAICSPLVITSRRSVISPAPLRATSCDRQARGPRTRRGPCAMRAQQALPHS